MSLRLEGTLTRHRIVVNQEGAVVRRQTAAELLHVFDVREVLEGLCARQATENAPPESWQDLVALFGVPTVALLEAGDIAGYLRHHETLRQRMLAACANPVLIDMLRPLHERVGFVMRRLVLTTSRADEALAEHRAVLAAMRAGGRRGGGGAPEAPADPQRPRCVGALPAVPAVGRRSVLQGARPSICTMSRAMASRGAGKGRRGGRGAPTGQPMCRSSALVPAT